MYIGTDAEGRLFDGAQDNTGFQVNTRTVDDAVVADGQRVASLGTNQALAVLTIMLVVHVLQSDGKS